MEDHHRWMPMPAARAMRRRRLPAGRMRLRLRSGGAGKEVRMLRITTDHQGAFSGPRSFETSGGKKGAVQETALHLN